MTSLEIKRIFEDRYGYKPSWSVFAPGRANIIGEHTDYNEGFVLPFAINQGIHMLAAKNNNGILSIYAANTGEKAEMLLDGETEAEYDWLRFFVQVIRYCPKTIDNGLSIVFGGNIPIGGGVSSSSALTCAFIYTLSKAFDWNLTATEILNIAVDAETGTGVRGGIMDQFTIINGKANEAIILDCRSQETDFVHIPSGDYRFVLINTNVKHNLINTDYNNRRAQCESAITLLNQAAFQIKSIRDIKVEQLDDISKFLDETLFNRVSFVVSENNRVLLAKSFMQQNDHLGLGSLLYASHEGLSKQYDVSCPELDWIVDQCRTNDNVAGARMMGGGFGGCVIAYIKNGIKSLPCEALNDAYKNEFGINLSFIEISAGNGMLN